MKTIDFNLNWRVRFILLPEGRKILKDGYYKYRPYDNSHPKEWDTEGAWITMQLWDCMSRFGPYLEADLGKLPPIQTLIQLEVEEK